MKKTHIDDLIWRKSSICKPLSPELYNQVVQVQDRIIQAVSEFWEIKSSWPELMVAAA